MSVQLNLIPYASHEHETGFRTKGSMILDIGGEGRHPEAWNLNLRSRKSLGKQRGELIPRLIQGRSESIPLPDGCVQVLIVERTPLRLATLLEMSRVASPSARIILRHANAHQRDPHKLAVQTLQGGTEQRVVMIDRQLVQETIIRLANDPIDRLNSCKPL